MPHTHDSVLNQAENDRGIGTTDSLTAMEEFMKNVFQTMNNVRERCEVYYFSFFFSFSSKSSVFLSRTS